MFNYWVINLYRVIKFYIMFCHGKVKTYIIRVFEER